jgi:hypothetical protein
MSRTFTLPKKGTGAWTEGWHKLTVSNAKYGTYNDSKYIDVWFDGYPDNFNMRIYEKHGKDGEEFAIGNLFRFANAGITDALESATGETVIKMDDGPEQLTGQEVNAFFYKNGKFTRILNQIAPTEFKNIVEEFDAKDVAYFKGKAERYFNEYVKPKMEVTEETTTETSDIPF